MLPRNRSRSVKRVFVRTQSGRNVIHFKKERPHRAHCRICGAVLGGVNSVRGVAKSEKVPTRIFAGQLCAGCAGEIVKIRSRVALGEMKIEEASLAQREFVKMMK